ncbi:PKD domain-containing protein [Seonamhaeicola sp. NFXS20]|uniref:PKD domain-containing protein n=1 Tax=Seonamhaeicola sp. NFXS20 TaxID=2816959 RepID=UPI003B9DCC61
MTYTIKRKYLSGIFILALTLAFISCYDSGFEAFEAPTGNVNNIQPNTLFTTSTSADNNLTIVFRSYSTDAVSYLWDFGDGNTSTEANPDYTYAAGGLYTVSLTTVSSDGLEATASVDVSPVSVDFDFTSIDSEVTFTNSTTGASSLVWDFGDGESVEWYVEDTEEDPNFSPVHSYKTAETFVVTLTATNYLGDQVSVSKNVEGLVLSTVPDFTFDVSGLNVDFTDTSILAVSYSWDFGDGNTSTEASPSHTYAVAGTYDVTLTTTNEAGVSRSVTKPVPVGGVEPTFKVIVQNSTCNDHTGTTSDNADAWDMTPGSTVVDDVLGTIDSPYRALWNNTELNAYIDANFCTNEQPGSTSDGNKFGPLAGGGRGVKIYASCRRLYQLVEVEPGVEYTFTIDSRSEAEGVNTEVFILNNEITTEEAINTEEARAINTDAYYVIDNDFNSSKSSSSNDTFTTTTFTFKASSNIAVIYVRALNAVDSSTEVFYDNIDIITPGF